MYSNLATAKDSFSSIRFRADLFAANHSRVFFRLTLLFGFVITFPVAFPRLRFLNGFRMCAHQLFRLFTIASSVIWGLYWCLIFLRVTTLIFAVLALVRIVLLVKVFFFRNSILTIYFLSASCIGLVHLVLNLPHPLSLFNSIFFPFLVPSPLVNLAFTQPGKFTDDCKFFF